MAKIIKISTKKRKERAKAAQIEECYRQREQQILEYQAKNPFSYLEWYAAWFSGWLRRHGLNLYSHPSPVLHERNLFRKSKQKYYVNWREEAKERQEEFLEERRGRKR